ncbi:MAG: ABC transporter ATP-binding protein/permease [Lachnospiraceae bacterium]|nr:ABC transporter ATP-binding protein/permease [Lachnospiraceae bacterium]
MKRIIKNLMVYKRYVCIILLLLVIQAYCDLSLPQYLSGIIDTGIQNYGVEYVVPEKITEEEFEKAQYFMLEDEANRWKDIYENDGEKDVLTLKEGLDRKELDETFLKPLLVRYQSMNEEVAGPIPEEMLLGIRDKVDETVETMGDTQLHSMGVRYAYECEKAAGVDLNKNQQSYLLRTGAFMLAMALVMALATILVGFFAAKIGAGIGRDLRRKVFTNVVSFSNGEMDRFSTASLITRSTNDIQQIQLVSTMLLRMVAYAPILGIGGIIKVISTKAGMGWIIGLALLVLLGVVAVLMSVALPKFKLMQKLVDSLNLVSREILTGLPVIRAFGREKREEERFDEANTRLMKTQLFTSRVMSTMLPLMMLIMNGLTVLIVWVAAHRIEEGTMQVGTLTAFITYAIMIVMSFLMLTAMSIMLPRAAVAANRIDEVLATESSIKEAKHPKHIEHAKGKIAFENVSFAYPGGEENALTDISFEAKCGETTAIIGSTGCGKSTLVNLIPRLYDVTEGRITLDGEDIREIALKDLRENIGFVPQKGVLFSGTIASNLRFGKGDASEEELREAARIAQADDFIEEKDHTYDSEISQGGTNVSGGQKQRLSIARAIAKNPKIYIFDDSFSALDLKTDRALRAALKEKVEDATVLIVAQRISTIMNAEQIIVLDEGRIVGKGTHKELLQNCEVYKQIATSQLSEKELEGMNDGKEEKSNE